MLEELRGLGFKDKKAAAFGCYGWSGESVPVINEQLKKAGFMVVDDGLKVLWNPDSTGRKACFEVRAESGKETLTLTLLFFIQCFRLLADYSGSNSLGALYQDKNLCLFNLFNKCINVFNECIRNYI